MSIDLDGYFKRIGYDGPRKPTLAVLRELHRLQPQVIAFENLDPLLKRPVKLDAASLDAKLVKGGRGGYCFEQNLLFGHVLRALGFKVQEATARVRWSVPPGVHTPRVHALLIVEAEGESYLVDVGFGGNVATGPLMLKSRDEQKTPHEPFRLVEEDHRLVVEAKIAGEWTSLYATDLAESIPADFEMANWFTSAHPEFDLCQWAVGGARRSRPPLRPLQQRAYRCTSSTAAPRSANSMRANCATRLAIYSICASRVSTASTRR